MTCIMHCYRRWYIILKGTESCSWTTVTRISCCTQYISWSQAFHWSSGGGGGGIGDGDVPLVLTQHRDILQ